MGVLFGRRCSKAEDAQGYLPLTVQGGLAAQGTLLALFYIAQ
jgi:hypothetical protein